MVCFSFSVLALLFTCSIALCSHQPAEVIPGASPLPDSARGHWFGDFPPSPELCWSSPLQVLWCWWLLGALPALPAPGRGVPELLPVVLPVPVGSQAQLWGSPEMCSCLPQGLQQPCRDLLWPWMWNGDRGELPAAAHTPTTGPVGYSLPKGAGSVQQR